MDKPKRKTFYKHCIVRTCGNNSTKSPGKAYIRVPLDQELRHTWMNAVGRKTTDFSSTNRGIYVCEDHFDLESDMENYLEWKLTGEGEVMKKTAVPRIIHSRETQNESARRELDQLLGLHEEISIKIEPPEENSHEVNASVSSPVRKESPREETVGIKGLFSTVTENRDKVACKKRKRQTPKPKPEQQNINLSMEDTPTERDPHKEINVSVLNIVRDKSLREEPVGIEGLLSTVTENRNIVACKKSKRQTPRPKPRKQNINSSVADTITEKEPQNKVNVSISNVMKDKSSTEDIVRVEGFVSTRTENRDLVACKKRKKQILNAQPEPEEQNINLAMNIQIKIKRILKDGKIFEELAKSETQSHQSDVDKKQILAICGGANCDEPRDSSSLSEKCASQLSSDNTLQKRDTQESIVVTSDASCEKQDQRDKLAKRAAAKLRAPICPVCNKRIVSHLPRHLERHHKDNKEVRLLRKLNPNSQERAQLLAAIRKRGYFRLQIESNLLIPVRASSNPDVEYFVCPYCLGHYSKRFLHRHVKQCYMRPTAEGVQSRNCLSTSQTFMAEVNAGSGESISSRLKDEVFGIMRADHISFVAKNDPLIRLYGDRLLAKLGSKTAATTVSNKIREMSRLLLALRSTRDLAGLADALKPEMFDELMAATQTISGYDPTAKTFRTPSLAVHMGNNLRFLCGVALDNASEDRRSEIQQLKTLLHIRWSSALSGLFQRQKSCDAPQESQLATDVKLLDQHIDALALDAFERLNSGAPVAPSDYKQLIECVLGQTAFFNRETLARVQSLTLDSYSAEEGELSAKTLTGVEEVLAARLKTVVCSDQDQGFVLIPELTRTYIDCLWRLREETDIVTQFNPYLFASPGSGAEWMPGDAVLRKLARGSGANDPDVLVSDKFRNLIATTLQLEAVREEELELLAATVGLRLPENIYQKTELARRLLLQKQQDVEVRETNCDQTQPEHDGDVRNPESEDDDLPLLERFLTKVKSSRKDGDNSSNRPKKSVREPQQCDSTRTEVKGPHEKLENVKRTRISWSEEEKSLVRQHFSKHIRENISPRKLECEEFLRSNPLLFQGRGWVQLKAFVYNTYRMMQ